MYLLPSWDRPHKIEMLVKHPTMAEAPIMLWVTEDAPMLEAYRAIELPDSWELVIGKPMKVGPIWNEAVKQFPDESYYGFIGDDCIPNRADWWEILIAAAEDWNIAYPDDGIHGEKLCTHPCIGGKFIRQLGWWANRGLEHSFIDTSIHALGVATGRLQYCPEVVLDHQHPLKDATVEMDACYERGQESYASDRARFMRWIHSDASKFDARRVLKGLRREGLYNGPL